MGVTNAPFDMIYQRFTEGGLTNPAMSITYLGVHINGGVLAR